ncbi:fatty acid synthase-like isoform X2 [Anthonomus grandis grandis]|uniref:fatty acid synthase-like isoform X2 n=1 Tax=Anthonomus grandis grandis TaxID=2921223 RepID=UPI002166498C|nr:fatty acid synthase-like isoform X2 [Anthonomus grandis grandis]
MVQDRGIDSETDPCIQFGKLISRVPPGEQVVISGMAGMFPLSENIEEYQYNLEHKIEMVTEIPSLHPEMPPRFGKMTEKSSTSFDAGFFGLHPKHNLTLSPVSKFLLEKCYECIFDAGLHPSDLKGMNTGVFLGLCFNEVECHWFLRDLVEGGNSILGNLRSDIANRICYELKLKGLTMVTDTACSSSAYALEAAFKAIRMGQCDAALVGSANLLISGGCSLQFARLGVLSPEGRCRPFDIDGLGYVRAEAASIILLQKAKDSKRIYARIVHTKTNCDGYKEHGITYPSGVAQYNLLKEIYLESGIRPADMSYIEAHGTGTIVGDPEETNAIDEFFTPGRSTPLLIGSCKSSIGHSEPVSALCSIVKVILAFERNNISPNINYKTPRPMIHGLIAGRLEVVVENTPFRDDNRLVGVSSFGFGGGNAHVILEGMKKIKTNEGRPKDKIPRLVCISGRTEEAIDVLVKDISEKFDAEYIGLVHNIFRKDIENHIYRGYGIVSEKGSLKMSCKLFNPNKSNVALFFGGLTKYSRNVLSELLTLPALVDFSNCVSEFFSKKELDLEHIMSNFSNAAFFIADMLTQLTLTELLKQLELKFTTIEARSFGKFSSAYFQDLISLSQFLECVYVVAMVAEKTAVSTNGSGIRFTALTKYEKEILKEFKRILPAQKQMNGFQGPTMPRDSPEFLVNAVFEKNQIELSKKRTYSTILEVGQSLAVSKKIKCPVLNMSEQNSLVDIFDIIGSLYENGLQPQLYKLYPKIEFPVSRGTPMISPKIKWKHDRKQFLPSFDCTLYKTYAMVFRISPNEDEWAGVDGHVIDGKNLFPATGYLFLAWTVFAELLAVEVSKLGVVFENCKFLRACNVPKADALSRNSLELHVMIQKISGNFEITEEGIPVVTGRIKLKDAHSMPNISFKEQLSEKTMDSKDIYKELRLRGYHYKGLFKKIIQCNQAATRGKIQWCDNWIAFMDNMLQMQILSEDTRLLFVPTKISKLTIDPDRHWEQINLLKKGQDVTVDLPVEVYHNSGIIRSGGIEISGLLASSIPRKKTTAVPVLEKYQFVPNQAQLPLEQAVRVFTQIALENHCGLKIKAVEVLDEESDENLTPLAPLIQEVLSDQPLVQTDISILTSQTLDLNVNVQNKKLQHETDCTLVVGSKLLSRTNLLQDAVAVTKDIGFVISRESLDADTSQSFMGLQIINICRTPQEMLVFLKKSNQANKSRVFINVNTKTRKFDWLEELKEAVKKDQDVIAWCQNEPLNGIIGLINCISKEPDCKHIRCLFIVDKAPNFEPTMPFYKVQLDKQLVINVFKNGSWGTYRHLILDDVPEVESEHCYANSTVRGDLSSIKWIEGPLKIQNNKNQNIVKIYYASLNFRDVMTASGRINADVITRNRREQECVQGFEFSGKTLSGKRVMGMLSQGTLATMVKSDENLLWDVPNKWTLKDAATVPVVYSTCLYALVVVGKIKPGNSVLIHSGTGGIGQAAINLCLNMGCTVFTTVGTEEKRKYIKRNFPQINESHIGNSRDLSFEQMIMKETNGAGVDIVLNSLAEEKLQTSVRCLAKNGRFLEIGKFDLANDNQLTLLPFEKGISYHGVMLDKLFNEPDEVKMELKTLLQKFIDSGAVKPLQPTVFKTNEVEQAFRFMTTGKHMGKVLVEIRNEDEQHHQEKFKCLPRYKSKIITMYNFKIYFLKFFRYLCDPNKTYVICGGLGGFGLELADWLILRGAQNLVLTSRKGISTGYQQYRVSIWKSYGCNITISTKDITTKQGCEDLIKEANSIAPIGAIFNLAVVLRDAILPNQNEESFAASFGPKACATEYLDEITRKLCPQLRDFVVFSSVSCGRGNAGQTNYGMSNSVMERICEKRRADGYPGLAIQWGAIGEVGLVAEMQEDHVELEIGGTLQQSISNCLHVMDTLLRQNDAAIVSSMVVAEKKTTSLTGNIMEVIGGILGIRDIKAVSIHSTFAELGMDSMTGVEVKQTLEREYNIFLSPTEIRSVTLKRIKEMQEEGESGELVNSNESEGIMDWPVILRYVLESEEQKGCIIKLKSKSSDKDPSTLPRIIALPGIEGVCRLIESLTENLEVDAYGVNYIAESQEDSIQKSVNNILPHVEKLLQKHKPFHILAHSMGSLLALEIVARLEKLGFNGTVTFIDGSPHMLKLLVGNQRDEDLANILIDSILRIQKIEEEAATIMKDICPCPTLDDKLTKMVQNLTLDDRMTDEFVRRGFIATWKRIQATRNYSSDVKLLKSKPNLFKASILSVKNLPDDYELGQYFEEPLNISVLEGTHTTILQRKELADAIMSYIK